MATENLPVCPSIPPHLPGHPCRHRIRHLRGRFIGGTRACLAICGALLALVAAPARAGETPRDLLQQAQRQFDLADFEGALKLLERAGKVAQPGSELARVLIEKALVIGELQGLGPAHSVFAQALRQDPLACPDRARAKGNLVALCEEIRDAGRGVLVLGGPGRGRSVVVDGKTVLVPSELKLTLGAHSIVIRGRRSALTRRVVLGLDQRLAVEVPLEPELAAVTAPGRESDRQPGRRRVWTWVIGGAAASLAAASLGCWLAGDRQYGHWRDLASEDHPDEAQMADVESSIRRLEVASWVMVGTAAAAAVVSAVLFWREGVKRPSRAAALVSGRAGRPGLLLSGEF
jgi:hypothetical protein